LQRKIDRRLHDVVQHAIEYDGTKFVSGQKVVCSFPGCDHEHRIVTNNRSHRLPDAVAKKKFQQKGWALKGNDWLCPTHAKKGVSLRVVEVVPVQPDSPLFDLPPAAVPPPLRIVPSLSIDHHAYRVAHIPEPAAKLPPPKETPIVPIIQHHNQTPPTTLKSFGDLANAAIEKMSRSDHRRIFKAIMDNWDENKGRYLADYGDQKAANELNVPRAWVEHVRKEAFGDTGDNEELVELREDLEAMERKFQQYANEGLTLATRMDEMVRGARQMLTRLEKVEKATGVRR
jgi:hypothetical protein